MKNIQESNIFYKRINRFTDNINFVKEEFETFDFNDNLKSNKIEELEFTNYLSSNQCDKYYLLLDICKKLYENYNNINKLFIADEFDPHRYHSKRVYDIMNTVNNKQIDKKIIIYKFKCKKDPAIQFYVSKENKSLKLYLIDIYHIVIETINIRTGKADRVAIYNKRKKCSFDIKKIQEELSKSTEK